MAQWVPIIKQINEDPDATVVEMLFTDNQTQKFMKEYRIPALILDDFKREVQAEIDRRNAGNQDKGKLAVGPFDTTITPPPLTPRQQFLADLILLNQMNRAIALGFLKADDPLVTAQISKMKGNFDPSYIDLF